MNERKVLARAATLAEPWMTFPNPRVGCVIVDARGQTVGEGAHESDGGPHAEIHALRAAGGRAQGGTAFVTLEPCAHIGRTGSCAQALIDAGIARVVFGVADPNPTAAGGAGLLRTAGVDVDFLASPESERVNEAWLHAMRTGRPFVTLKLATTLDGRVAARAGVETRISNDASRRRVHALRSRVDAVLVGSNTALVDDPKLTVRDVPSGHQPQRFVMGQRDLPGHLWMFTSGTPAEQLRTHEPEVALAELQRRSVRHLLIEGGPTVAAAFLALDLVDECIWITAPRVFGAGPTISEFLPGSAHNWVRRETVDIDGDLWSYLRVP